MLPTCLLEPVSLSHHVCDLAESRGFLGGKRESGKDSRVVSNGLSARTVATAMPNLTCVTVREPRLLPCVNRAAGIPANERELAHGERRIDILYQALFGVDIQVVSI